MANSVPTITKSPDEYEALKARLENGGELTLDESYSAAVKFALLMSPRERKCSHTLSDIVASDASVFENNYRYKRYCSSQSKRAGIPDDFTQALRRQFFRLGTDANTETVREAVSGLIPEDMSPHALGKRIERARRFVRDNPRLRGEYCSNRGEREHAN